MQDYLYSVIGFIAIAVHLIINYKLMFHPKNGSIGKADKMYRRLMLSVLAYYITDAMWGVLAGLNWIPLLFADTTLYYVAMCSAIVYYFGYIVEYLKMKNWRGRLFIYIGNIFITLEAVFLVVNFFYPCFFWFDDNDAYVAGIFRYIALWIQVGMFALSSLVTLHDALKTSGASKKRHIAIFLFSLIMLIAVLFQEKYPLLPFYALGCLLGCCVLHEYVAGDEQEEFSNQLSNYKQAILSEALIALEVNLTRDELYYGVWKDDDGNEIALEQILGLSIPCSYDKYIGEWNRRFVSVAHNTAFCDSTSREFLMKQFRKGRTEVSFDYEAKTVSGKPAWLRRSIVMTLNQDREIIAYTSVKDISSAMEQKAREDAYMQALETEYDSISVVEVVSEDKHDDKVLVRGRLTDRFASLIDEETANEKHYSQRLEMMLQFVHPDDREMFFTETRREKVLQECNANRTHIVNFRIVKKDGDFVYYQLSFIPLLDDSGKATKVITVMKDVDDEVRKEKNDRQKLEDARYAAEAASRAKTAFLFNMSHDIRTPMNAILGFTDIAIKHRGDQAKVDDSLAKIKTAGGHLLNLINDVLEMSRIESERLEICEDPSDIRKLIDGVNQMTNSLAISKSIDFVTEIGSITNPYVYLDELHVNEVLINLTSNAVKYTPAGGSVHLKVNQLSTVTDGKAVFRFAVEDNGIGMGEEFQQHLFEAFSREKTSTVSRMQGAGLGLSIVKKIVDLVGGTITVRSKQHEGSIFTVELPLRVMDEEAIREYEEENEPLDFGTGNFYLRDKKVLLVEDNEMNREIATEILEESGLAVDTAEDGAFAVQAVTEKGCGYYDFILMDIQMPVMDGYEATKAIRALPGGNEVTIIALSANAFEEDIQKSLSIGMNAHVAKPIDVRILLETMKALAK